MFDSIFPQNREFIRGLSRIAGRLTASARLLQRLFEAPHGLDSLVDAIRDASREAEVAAHDVDLRLDKALLPPIDREDVHRLARQLQAAVDVVAAVAERARAFHIENERARVPAREMSAVIVRTAVAIESAVARAEKAPREVMEWCAKVRECEAEGEAIYQTAMEALFDGTPDALEVVKWKDLYDTLARALEQCRHTASALESIALKHG